MLDRAGRMVRGANAPRRNIQGYCSSASKHSKLAKTNHSFFQDDIALGDARFPPFLISRLVFKRTRCRPILHCHANLTAAMRQIKETLRKRASVVMLQEVSFHPGDRRRIKKQLQELGPDYWCTGNEPPETKMKENRT